MMTALRTRACQPINMTYLKKGPINTSCLQFASQPLSHSGEPDIEADAQRINLPTLSA